MSQRFRSSRTHAAAALATVSALMLGAGPSHAQTCGVFGFGPPADYASSSATTDVAVADFNEDGHLDLVASNDFPNDTVSIWLGTGTGTFGARTEFRVGSDVGGARQPVSVLVGDFNEDGHVDVVTGNSNGQSISFLPGTGAGTLGERIETSTNQSLFDAAVADANGDGHLDLLIGQFSFDGGDVAVMLGDGAGNFAAPTSFVIPHGPFSLVVGNFDSSFDANVDVVALTPFAMQFSLLLGNGAGSFAAFIGTATGAAATTGAAGDFNGDGHLDLTFGIAGGSQVSVWLGNGTAGFGAESLFAVGANPIGVTVGDVNGDGALDIVTSNTDANTMSVLLGNGAGSFAAAVTFPVGGGPQKNALADFNHDGRLDFVTSNRDLAAVSVLLANGPCAPGYGSTPTPGSTIAVGSADIGSPVSTALTVSETGNATLDVTSHSLSGAHAADFGVSPATLTIPDGGPPQALTITCTPSAAGLRTATLTVNHNATGSPATYSLQCTGTVPAAPGYGSSPAPGSTIAVGSANVGAPVSTALTVSETGNATLIVTGHSVSGAQAADFTVTPATLTIPDGGAAQALTIACTPSAAGARTATLTVSHNAPGSPATYQLTCTGIAVVPRDPYADAIGPGTSALVLHPTRAIGAPDGRFATVVSLLGTSLVLDMGAREEGTGHLKVHYGGLSVELVTQVEFLRADQSVISRGTLRLVHIGLGTHVAVVTYAGTPTPYRYVRIRGVLLGAFGIDAIEATSIVP